MKRKIKYINLHRTNHHHHHKPRSLPLPKEGFLSACFPQLPVFRNVTSSRSYISDLVVSPSRSWSASRFFMSAGYPFCDSGCPSVVTSPRHVFRLYVFAFSYVPANVCYTTHFLYLVMVLSHHLPEIYVFVDLLDLLLIDNHIILIYVLVTHYLSLPGAY